MSIAFAISYGVLAAQSASKMQITSDVEARFRFERRVDRTFGATSGDGRSELLWRVRPGLTFTGDGWRARLQWQSAYSLVWTEARNFSTENQDASLAQVEFDIGKGKLTVGRQKITLGDERLIGTLEWSNLARSMDGVRYREAGWDVFGFRFGVPESISKEARVFASSYRHKAGTSTYILKLDEIAGGDVTVHTLDHVWRGKVADKITAEGEIAVQVGKVGSRDLAAYAVHGRLDYAATSNVSVGVEANLASGGQSGQQTKTFDNLYPTNHKFYGAADLQGWRNMQELAAHFVFKTDAASSVAIGWHHFWLFDKTDGWYGAGGAINTRPGGSYIDPSGNSGRYVGSELDITYNRRLNAFGSISVGMSWFDPGAFVTAVNGGNGKTQVWAFGMIGYRF